MVPLLLGLLVAPQRSLLITARSGDTARYEIKMIFDDGGQKLEMSGRAEDRITKIDENGNLTNEHLLGAVKFKVDGQEVDVSDSKKQVTILKPTGEIVELVGGSSKEARFVYATMIVVPPNPVKDGESWNFQLSPKGGIAIKQEYTAVVAEKIGTYEAMKVRIKSWEASGSKPIRAEGTVWLSLTDGRLVKQELNVEGVPMGEEGKPTKLTLLVMRM